MMSLATMGGLIKPLIEIVEEAGEQIVYFYQGSIAVEIKQDNTPLTIADKTAHEHINQALEKLTPGVPILSEEGVIPDYDERQHWQQYWLVDPLDGTRDFVNKTGDFSINIALIQNNRVVLGMIYAPLSRSCYFAHPAKGAFKKDEAGIKPIRVANKPRTPVKVVVGNYVSKSERMERLLTDQFAHNYQFFEVGSSLKFCYIAEGIYDYYPRLGPCSEWDTAAGVCILECAGGSVVNEQGKTLTYNAQPSLKSPVFFAAGFKQ